MDGLAEVLADHGHELDQRLGLSIRIDDLERAEVWGLLAERILGKAIQELNARVSAVLRRVGALT